MCSTLEERRTTKIVRKYYNYKNFKFDTDTSKQKEIYLSIADVMERKLAQKE